MNLQIVTKHPSCSRFQVSPPMIIQCCRRRQCRGTVVSVILCPRCQSCQCPIQHPRRCVAETVTEYLLSQCPSQCPSQRSSEWNFVRDGESEVRQRHGDCSRPPAPTPQTERQSGECVYRSKAGRRWHKRASCRALRRTDRTALSLSEAQAAGLTPCNICSF